MPKTRDKTKFGEYYSRQILLGELGSKGQKTLARSKVAVVGLGGLGTVSSLYLALSGVGHLRLIDQDTAAGEHGANIRQSRPPQVIGDDDAGEALAGERPVAAFQIELQRGYPGHPT